MKKLLVLPLVLMLTSCTVPKVLEKPSSPTPTPDAPISEPVPENIITASDTSAANEDFTPIKETEYDFDLDGVSDHVVLYSNAKPNSSGDMMWDDFHQWILEVETNSGDFYTLFNNSISTGQLYFELFEIYNDDVIPAITTFVTSGSGIDIFEYTFAGNEFSEKKIYSAEDASTSGINKIYSSVPHY